MILEGKKINFLGDSITFGAGLVDVMLPEFPEGFDFSQMKPEDDPYFGVDPDSLDDSYVNVLKRECALAAGRNYGICGSRISRQPEEAGFDLFPETFCDRIDLMEPDADIVVVFGGTNDFGHGLAPLGRMSDRTDASFYGALHVMMLKLIDKYPDAEIVICTPLHRAGENNPFGDGSKKLPGAILRDYVKAVREVAEYYALPVLDLYATSGIQPNVPSVMEKYCPDGLHPNKAGNEQIARRMKRFLEAL